MTVKEVKAIKEKMSLETTGMTGQDLSAYYSQGAKEIQKMVEYRRKQNRSRKHAIGDIKNTERIDQVNPN